MGETLELAAPRIQDSPGMANTNDMVDIAKRELKKLVRQYTRSISEPKEGMIGKDRLDAYIACMKDAFVAHTRQCLVAMHDLDPLAKQDGPKDGKQTEEVW